MNDEIMVSVICLAYNHEPYIKQCLEGFVNQKTGFKYEVLIHDDASTDKTADIIREYEAKYPDIIKPIYQTENQYSKGIKPSKEFLIPKAKGKYLAWCEGDDYWCDEIKLQTQFDIMEANSNCIACFHATKRIDEGGNDLNDIIPNIKLKEGVYNSYEWLEMYFQNAQFVHTTSFFFRAKAFRDMILAKPEFMRISPVGDKPLVWLSASLGEICYVNKVMSAYRICSKGSWSERINSFSEEKKADIFNRSVLALQKYDEFTNYRFTELVNLTVKNYYFIKTIEKKEYKKLFSTENKPIFSRLTKKEKMYYRFFAMFPKLEEVYKNIRGRK